MVARPTLDMLADVATRVDRVNRDEPVTRKLWLPGQLAFLSDPSDRKLYRAGSQWAGKTTAGAAELLWRMRGDHPFYAVPPPPRHFWIMASSAQQGVILQKKVWALTPKHLVSEDCVFDGKKFVGLYPVLRFRNGSTAEFRASNASSRTNLSSDTIDGAWVDEPPERGLDVWTELNSRVMRRAGTIWVTLTPLHNPCDWLRAECAAGRVKDHHFRMTVENLIPVGYDFPLPFDDGTPMDEAFVARRRASVDGRLAPIALDGEWEGRATGAALADYWDRDRHVRPFAEHPLRARGPWKVLLGVDFGHRPGKSVATLVLLNTEGEHPVVHVWDEWAPPGASTPAADAAGILEMLKRNNSGWHKIDEAWGDRVHMSGTWAQRSVDDLMAALAGQLGIIGGKAKLAPPISTVRKRFRDGEGPVEIRERWAAFCMARPIGFSVEPRCVRVISSLERYTGKDDEHKDPFDSWTYACQSTIFPVGNSSQGPAPVVRFRG